MKIHDMISDAEREMMLHATGGKRGGRNHYCAGHDSEEAKVWRGLVARGLAGEGGRINDGRDAVFRVSAAGYDALHERPPPGREGDTCVPHGVEDCATCLAALAIIRRVVELNRLNAELRDRVRLLEAALVEVRRLLSGSAFHPAEILAIVNAAHPKETP